jgi:tetrahydromethanopterin S-methyltransferase subunit E
MNYVGTFCTLILKHVQAAYIIRGPFPLAMLMIIFKPASEARSYGQVFYFPTEYL